jgi:CRP-like cAMP-binding protein
MASTASNQLEQVLGALQSSEVLKAFSPDACRALALAGSPINLSAGGVLCQAGDPGDSVFVILDGEIEVRAASPGGRDVRLVALGRGAVVGEMAALDGGDRSADMVATRRSRLWRIPRAALLERLEAEPKAAVALLVELSARLRKTNAALESRATLGLGGRLAQLVLAEQNTAGIVALTQSELARRLGASREKVNRKLHEWAGEGLVVLTPSGVRLQAPDRLLGVVASQANS